LASRNLKRPDIQEQIKARIEAAKLDTDEIIGTLIGHMRADIGNLLGDDGALDLARAIENGSTHIIKKLVIRTRRIAGPTGNTGRSLTVREGAAPDPTNDLMATETQPIEETTYEIVLHDSQSAAWRLARILHLEVKNRPIEARRPTDDELAHRMADLLERARANGRREAARQQPPRQTMECHAEDSLASPLEPEMQPASPAARREPGLSRAQLQTSGVAPEMPPPFPATLAEAQDDALPTNPRITSTGQTPGFGLWNRIFGPVPTLTFINSLRTPLLGSDDLLTSSPELFEKG
jgi:hypothetical protein